MSQCVGEGCTQPGCSGRNAAVVNAMSPAARMQQALAMAEAAGATAWTDGNEPVAVQPNRADRRRAERAARRRR